MSSADSIDHVFRDRINYLFDVTNVTYRQVVKGTHGIVKETYLWQLRSGRACNPSYKVIAALAQFFNVHPGYFFTDTEGWQQIDFDDLHSWLGNLVKPNVDLSGRLSEGSSYKRPTNDASRTRDYRYLLPRADIGTPADYGETY